MKSLSIGGLAICLLVIGVATGVCDEASCGRMFARALEAFANFLSWVNSYPKGPLAFALIVIFLVHRLKGKPMP